MGGFLLAFFKFNPGAVIMADEAVIQSLGDAGTVKKMTQEKRADALEELEIERLDALVASAINDFVER
jgi:hypothetical protein